MYESEKRPPEASVGHIKDWDAVSAVTMAVLDAESAKTGAEKTKVLLMVMDAEAFHMTGRTDTMLLVRGLQALMGSFYQAVLMQGASKKELLDSAAVSAMAATMGMMAREAVRFVANRFEDEGGTAPETPTSGESSPARAAADILRRFDTPGGQHD